MLYFSINYLDSIWWWSFDQQYHRPIEYVIQCGCYHYLRLNITVDPGRISILVNVNSGYDLYWYDIMVRLKLIRIYTHGWDVCKDSRGTSLGNKDCISRGRFYGRAATFRRKPTSRPPGLLSWTVRGIHQLYYPGNSSNTTRTLPFSKGH